MVAVDHFLRGDALLAGAQGDGYTVFVAAADHHYVLALETHVARVDVSRDIDSGEVSDVNGPVGIGEGGGDECTLEFLFHNY